MRNHRERAERDYQQMVTVAEQRQRWGISVGFSVPASVNELEGFYQMLDRVAEESGVPYLNLPFGTTEEQAREKAQAKAKARRRRAGVRALQAKYGQELAERIVSKHAGRHISLKR